MTHQPAPTKNEPPFLERVRRIGWGLLALCIVLGGLVRFAGTPGWVTALAVAAAVFGLLAIINVALVRGLYRGLENAPGPAQDGPSTGSGTREP